MLISVHVPKTAGISFRAALEENFRAGLILDYQDAPINTEPLRRKKMALEAAVSLADKDFSAAKSIHGHFLPVKYLVLAEKMSVQFVTWLRDPVERLVSHYYYWHQTYHPETSFSLHKRVVLENWSLEKFCLSEEMRNFYAQFFWAFPLSYFSFIGITEFFNDDFSYFVKRFLTTHAEPKYLNIGAKKPVETALDPGFRRIVEEWHATDMAIYQSALDLRGKRLV